MIALEKGAEVIITIDDDNFAGKGNWYFEHLNSFFSSKIPVVRSKNTLINPCNILKFNYPSARVYSRGFPLEGIFADTFEIKKSRKGKVVLNMGLWYESPDVDAFTNLIYPGLKSLGIKTKIKKYKVERGNYIPINTQNTAFLREATPACYAVLMDTQMYGVKIDRYDDIWFGFFLTKIAHRLKHDITFGTPLTLHIRNKHDYVKDFRKELFGMIVNSRVFEIVKNCELDCVDYFDGYIQLAEKLNTEIREKIKDSKMMKYFNKLSKAMKIWVEVVEKVM